MCLECAKIPFNPFSATTTKKQPGQLPFPDAWRDLCECVRLYVVQTCCYFSNQ